MKDLTDRELLDLVDSAMKTIVARFKAEREAGEKARPEPPPPRDSAA